jgi:hypothetical protein
VLRNTRAMRSMTRSNVILETGVIISAVAIISPP